MALLALKLPSLPSLSSSSSSLRSSIGANSSRGGHCFCSISPRRRLRYQRQQQQQAISPPRHAPLLSSSKFSTDKSLSSSPVSSSAQIDPPAEEQDGGDQEQDSAVSFGGWSAAGCALLACTAFAGAYGQGVRLPDGFIEASTLTFFSEIGDKTFFIALVLAARDPVYRLPVFFGTWGALSTMTILSTVLGRLVHSADDLLPPNLRGVLPIPLDDFFAVALLLFFGYNTIVDALQLEDGALQEEEEEAREAVSDSKFVLQEISLSAEVQLALATFSLVFLAEWGDKSQLSTIALASSYSPVGVASGAVCGFLPICLLAVLGGSILGDSVSEKVLSLIAGVIFVFIAMAIVGNDLLMHS